MFAKKKSFWGSKLVFHQKILFWKNNDFSFVELSAKWLDLFPKELKTKQSTNTVGDLYTLESGINVASGKFDKKKNVAP
jgi:hypothetical protein